MSRDQPVYVPPLCLQDVDLSSIGLFYICAAVVFSVFSIFILSLITTW